MKYVGIWNFDSIRTMNESDEFVYLNAEEYLKSPMPYIDESDEEAVADEIKERKQIIGSKIEICEDGSLYMLIPLPEGVTKEEVDEAVSSGGIVLRRGMISGGQMGWEERDGEFWYSTGMGEDDWTKGSEDGYLNVMLSRYTKAE